MKVAERELPDMPVEALVATDAHDLAGVHAGETVAYRCECGAADETLMQLIHEPECELAGEHGRAHYDVGERPVVESDPTPEFEQDHRIDIVKAGWTCPDEGIHNGEAILFRCAECGNADETLAEIRHDEDCGLAGRYGKTAEKQKRAIADGGERAP